MKIDDTLYIGNLIGTYGKLLTDKQYSIMSDYYFDNLSLGEISDNYGITRQAVNFTIKQSLGVLYKYESKLHVLEKFGYIEDELNHISTHVDDDTKTKINNILDKMRS